MEKKELPLEDNNPIKSIQYFIPAIALTESDSLPWFYNNYINLDWIKNDCIRFGINNINVSYAEPIKAYILSRSFIIDNDIDIIDFIRRSISSKQYVQLTLDEYYIEGKKFYQKEHILHDNLIYGFSETEIFLYGYGNTRKLQRTSVKNDEFSKSFYFEKEKVNYIISSVTYADLIFVLKKIKSDYQTDIQGISEQIKDYLEGNCYARRYREARNIDKSTVSGIKVYEKLKNVYYESEEKIDLRNACVLRDHKQLMIKRIEYLHKQLLLNRGNSLLKGAVEISEKAEQLVFWSLKYNITKDTSIISTTEKIISEMRDMDCKLMEEFLESCKKML